MQFPSMAQSWLIHLIHAITARQQQRALDSLNNTIQRRKDLERDARYDLYDAVIKQMEDQKGDQGEEEIQLSELWTEAAMLYVAG